MADTDMILAANDRLVDGANKSFDEGATRSNGTVLIADSDKAHRAWVAETLLTQGYSIVLASSGEEALDRIAAGGIDLLVSAIAMPGIDGFEVLRALRDTLPGFPVIVVASGMSEMDWLCLKGASLLGAAAAYTQPLTPSVFLNSIRELLASRPD